jgi:hypothetical protein
MFATVHMCRGEIVDQVVQEDAARYLGTIPTGERHHDLSIRLFSVKARLDTRSAGRTDRPKYARHGQHRGALSR